MFVFGQQDCVSGAVDVESVWFVEFPLSVDVFAVREVKECGSIEFIVVPMGDVKGEVVVYEDTQSVSLFEGVGGSLILAVTVVDYICLHLLLFWTGWGNLQS